MSDRRLFVCLFDELKNSGWIFMKLKEQVDYDLEKT